MTSTITETAKPTTLTTKTTPLNGVTKNNDKMATNQQSQQQKSKKLTRSSSMERIKKLNTLICSQNYNLIIAALITWIRAPHHKLQAKLEHFIAILKFVLFSTFLPRLALKLCISATQMSYQKFNTFLASTEFMKVAVYSALATIFLQLVICLYYLSGVMQSGGFVFMCSCLYLITQMNYSCLQFFLKEKTTDIVAGRVVQVQKRLSRRDILGKRTISNMNLI